MEEYDFLVGFLTGSILTMVIMYVSYSFAKKG